MRGYMCVYIKQTNHDESISLLLELCKAVRLPFLGHFHLFSHLPICPHFKRLKCCHISGGYCPHVTSV